MLSIDEYKSKRNITDEQMEETHKDTQAYIDACNLREARKANNMTQIELAKAMGVSQNRVSRMENGDIEAMSIETVLRYLEALGGHMTLVAELLTGKAFLT